MADTLKNDTYKGLKSPHARPWLAVVGEVPATFAAHAAWGDQPLAAVGLTVASLALTAATWWAGRDTKEARRLHATATTAAATGYLTFASFTDPLGATQLSWLAIGGATVAASWNVRKVMRINPESKQDTERAGETGLLTKSLGKSKAMLRGEPKVEPNKVTAPYRITDPGSLTNADIGRRIDNIAGELGISPNSIRIVPDGENAAEGEFVFIPKDMLSGGAPYPGPSSAGGSILDPLQVGIYEDGETEQLWLPADEKAKRNATHILVAGMNGSAKSTGMTFAVIEALTRRDCVVWACDPSKGMQTFGPLLPYLDWVEMTQAGGEAMIDALPQVITARADELGRNGFKNWTPEAYAKLGMPYMIFWIEEAARFFRDGAELETVVEAARSAGITVVVSLQRPSATTMPTDVREQLGAAWCFGVKGSTTADMALPDDVRDAGARPEAWENRKPGYNYLVGPGVDDERYAMKARTWDPITDDEIREVLAALAVPTPAGATTTVAAGEAYAARTVYMPDQELTSVEQEETVMSKDDQKAAEEALLERQVARDIASRMGDGEEEPDLSGIDPDKEIPPVEQGQVWKFAEAEKHQEKSTSEAEAELMRVLEECREQGLDEIGPKHFQPHGKTGRYGRSRSWLSGKLTELADEGVHLEETEEPGVYRLLYPEMAAA